MRAFVLLAAALFASGAFCQDVKLVSFPNFFGEPGIYLKNEGSKTVTVLTEGLSTASGDGVMSFSVSYWFVEAEGKKVKLKQSLCKFAPVHLAPGEIALLKTTVGADTKEVSYEIDKEFGEAHGIWVGRTTIKLKQ